MEEIDLKELFNMFWSRKFIILLIVVVFIGMGIFYTKFMVKPDYRATATLVLTKNTSNNETITQTEVTLNQRLVATYTEFVKSSKLLRQVISNLNTDISEDDLRSSVNVKLVTNTQLIEISVTNENPEMAKLYANEITKVFIERVKEVYKIDNISILNEAKTPEKPYNINNKKNILVFAFIGIVIAGGYVLIVSMLDTTIKSAEAIEKSLGLNVLAAIPNYDFETKETKKRKTRKT